MYSSASQRNQDSKQVKNHSSRYFKESNPVEHRRKEAHRGQESPISIINQSLSLHLSCAYNIPSKDSPLVMPTLYLRIHSGTLQLTAPLPGISDPHLPLAEPPHPLRLHSHNVPSAPCSWPCPRFSFSSRPPLNIYAGLRTSELREASGFRLGSKVRGAGTCPESPSGSVAEPGLEPMSYVSALF